MDKRQGTITLEPIERHRYSELIVRLSILLYTRTNCGFRQVVTILKIFNEVFGEILGKIPCHNTIENWVKKCGLEVYETAGTKLQDSTYGQIVDESMMIGSEKLLLTLGIPAKHQDRPLNHNDVTVLDIAVKESWNGECVEKQLTTAAEKVGHNPLYVISDNASIMCKGIRGTGFKHQRDISHSLAMHLERTYKNEPDFQGYIKLMADVKLKHNMKKIAYLLPPKQRTIARFLNISQWMEWSSKMLDLYHTLQAEERKVFAFIPANASLIDELSEVVGCINEIELSCKNKGLSKEAVSQCQQKIKTRLLCGNSRMRQIGEAISNFLNEELRVLSADMPINNSSDIVESIFGTYKFRKSPNKLNGVTSYILVLPIYTKLCSQSKSEKFDFKGALENIRIQQINDWSKKNLSQNLMQLRRECLKKAG